MNNLEQLENNYKAIKELKIRYEYLFSHPFYVKFGYTKEAKEQQVFNLAVQKRVLRLRLGILEKIKNETLKQI